MRQFFVIGLVLLSACGPTIRVNRPVIVGLPGRVYQSTTAEVSVDVLNNSTQTGDILVGETLIYEGVGPQDIKNVGFECNGTIVSESRRFSLRQTGSRTEYIYFRPQNGDYRVKSKPVSINCPRSGSIHRRTDKFEITGLSRVR